MTVSFVQKFTHKAASKKQTTKLTSAKLTSYSPRLLKMLRLIQRQIIDLAGERSVLKKQQRFCAQIRGSI